MKKINLRKKEDMRKKIREKLKELCEDLKNFWEFHKNEIICSSIECLLTLIILGGIAVVVIKNMPCETNINKTAEVTEVSEVAEGTEVSEVTEIAEVTDRAEVSEVTEGTESITFDYDFVIKLLLLNILVYCYTYLIFGGGLR